MSVPFLVIIIILVGNTTMSLNVCDKDLLQYSNSISIFYLIVILHNIITNNYTKLGEILFLEIYILPLFCILQANNNRNQDPDV